MICHVLDEGESYDLQKLTFREGDFSHFASKNAPVNFKNLKMKNHRMNLPDENSAQTEDRTCCIKLGDESERKRSFIAKRGRNFIKKSKKLICTW